MKLSEQLRQDHECGDFGNALRGYAERAKALEDGIIEAIEWDWMDEDAPGDLYRELKSLAEGE